MKKLTKKSSRNHKASLSSNLIISGLSAQFPEKFEAINALKDQGSRILSDARDMVEGAVYSIPASTRASIASTQRRVMNGMKKRPLLTTACAATIAAVGVGILANKYVSAKGASR